jgi:hypothetical protein
VLHYGYTREAWKALGFSNWTEDQQSSVEDYDDLLSLMSVYSEPELLEYLS